MLYEGSKPCVWVMTALLSVITLACDGEGGGPSLSFSEVFEAEEVTIEEQPDGTMLRLERVAFGTGSSDLPSASLPTLDKFAIVFAAMPTARYSVEAHTDSRGNSASNVRLSQDRANAVRDYLVALVGGPSLAFTTIGHGEAFPIANNATANGRAINRRVEIIVRRDVGAPVFRVLVSADRMSVIYDCDDFGGSASAAAGDFYVQAEFYADDDRGTILGAQTSNTLFQANDGDVVELDLVAEELFWATEDAVLEPRVDWFENDPGGAHQFDLSSDLISIQWDRASRCWLEDLGRDTYRCLPEAEGEIVADTIRINVPNSSSQDACVAELDWSITVERIDR